MDEDLTESDCPCVKQDDGEYLTEIGVSWWRNVTLNLYIKDRRVGKGSLVRDGTLSLQFHVSTGRGDVLFSGTEEVYTMSVS